MRNHRKCVIITLDVDVVGNIEMRVGYGSNVKQAT